MNIYINNVHISLLALFFLRGFEFGMIVPVMPYYYQMLTKDNIEALHLFSINSSIYGFMGLVMSFVVGPVYDKTRNAKMLLLPSAVVFEVGLCLYVISKDRVLSLISSVLMGPFSTLYVIGNAEISRLGKQTTSGSTLLTTCDTIGIVIASIFNLGLPTVSYRFGFIDFNEATVPAAVTVLVTAVVTKVFILTIDGPIAPKGKNGEDNFRWNDIPTIINDTKRLVLYLTGFVALYSFVSYSIFLQSTLLLCVRENIKAQSLTYLLAFLIRLAILAFIPKLSCILSERSLLIFINILQIFFLIGSSLSISLSLTWHCEARIANGIYSFAVIWVAANVLVVSSLGQLLSKNVKATGQGLMAFCSSICNFIAPVIADVCLDYEDKFSLILATVVSLVTLTNVLVGSCRCKNDLVGEGSKEEIDYSKIN